MGAINSGKIDTNQLLKTKRIRAKRRRHRNLNQWQFDAKIRRLNRVINGKMSIQKDSMQIINDVLQHFAEQICGEAKILCKLSGRKTLEATDLSDAVKLMFGEKTIYRHSQLECQKALISIAMSHATQ